MGTLPNARMRLPPDRLSGRDLASIKPGAKPAKHGDGGGLYLQVNPDGSRYWRFRYRFHGKQNNLSCGIYPAVSLEAARARRDEFLALLSIGVDPGECVATERSERTRLRAEQHGTTRFYLDDAGALLIQSGKHRFSLAPAETARLREFLDSTRALPCREPSCR